MRCHLTLHVYKSNECLPRQAWDRHKKKVEKGDGVFAGGFNPYDVGHEDDSDEEEPYQEEEEEEQGGGEAGESNGGGGGGFGLGRVSGSGLLSGKSLDLGKNL
eukprot:COSAG06_NODE_1693_length_8701_cov_80.626133_2_plen_103_part_00